MRSFLFAIVTIVLAVPALAEEPAAATPAAQTPADAVKRSLAFLQDKGGWWMREKKCASCHHVPMTVWSFQEAKARGFAVNEQLLSEMLTWTTSPDNAAKLLTPEPLKNKEPGKNKVYMGGVLLALALNAQAQTAP